MPKIRVLVVDDHTIVRDGICSLLGLTPDIEVIGEAANGKEALEALKKLMPDVVLMDLAMPIMGGLEATRQITKEFPRIKVLALTQYDDREYVFPIIEAGAHGFISKMAASSELTSSIRSVYHGDSFLSPSVAKLLVENYQQEASTVRSRDPYEQLTDREREILKLLAEASLMAKLDIHSRTDLVKYALRKGIITI